MLRRLLLVWFASILAVAALAQEKPSHHPDMHHGSNAARPKFDRAVIDQVWKAWETLDPKNAAKFYDQEPNHDFFDITPLKYSSWSEYQQGVAKEFQNFKSMKVTLGDDLKIHDHGDSFVFVTSTLKLDIVTKDNKSDSLACRWTSIWVNHGGQWKMAHEHLSAPAHL